MRAAIPSFVVAFCLLTGCATSAPFTTSTAPEDRTGACEQRTAEVFAITGAIDAEGDKALALGTGARGLRSVLEGVLLDTMYALPEAAPGSKFTVTAEAIRGEKPVTVSAASPKKKAS